MKKVISLCMAVIVAFLLCVGLISCSNTGNNSDGNNPNGNNPPSSEPFIVDLEGYVANIGNATALGISKKPKQAPPLWHLMEQKILVSNCCLSTL